MHPTCYEYIFLLLFVFEIGDSQHVNIVASRRFRQSLSLANHPVITWVRYFEQESVKHSESIGHGMGKIRNIVLLPKIKWETKFIVVLIPCFDVCLPICYILAPPRPSIVVALATKQYFHAILVRWIVFEKVEDVESQLAFDLLVVHPEEKPLGTTSTVYILLQQQVVLPLTLSSCCKSKIATFEPALKLNLCFIILRLGFVLKPRFWVKRFDACKISVITLHIETGWRLIKTVLEKFAELRGVHFKQFLLLFLLGNGS